MRSFTTWFGLSAGLGTDLAPRPARIAIYRGGLGFLGDRNGCRCKSLADRAWGDLEAAGNQLTDVLFYLEDA